MKKKCLRCKKILSLEFFPTQWNKKHQKYYPLPRCRECFNEIQRENYNNPRVRGYRNKYFSKGIFGWTPKIINHLGIRDTALKRDASSNIWDKKCDNLGEISLNMSSKQFKFRKFSKKNDDELYKKFVKRVIKDMKRNQKIIGIPNDIVQQSFYYKISMIERGIISKFNENIWDKKMYQMIKHYRILTI